MARREETASSRRARVLYGATGGPVSLQETVSEVGEAVFAKSGDPARRVTGAVVQVAPLDQVFALADLARRGAVVQDVGGRVEGGGKILLNVVLQHLHPIQNRQPLFFCVGRAELVGRRAGAFGGTGGLVLRRRRTVTELVELVRQYK